MILFALRATGELILRRSRLFLPSRFITIRAPARTQSAHAVFVPLIRRASAVLLFGTYLDIPNKSAPPSAFGTFPRCAGEGKAKSGKVESFPRFAGEGKAKSGNVESFLRLRGNIGGIADVCSECCPQGEPH